MEGLVRSSANYVPLSPIGFLERSGLVFRDRTALVYGTARFTWGQTLQRCTKLASALTHLGVSYGDVVAALLPNIPAMYELHFAVPMSGGILCTLNTRHDSAMVSVLLKHSDAKILFVDHQSYQIAQVALDLLSKTNSSLPKIILVTDTQSNVAVGTTTMPAGVELEYENFLETGDPDFEIRRPRDELDPISLNYTSGTTSSPKGVVYSHRGAYLNSLAAVLLNEMRSMPVYLWTVPMFHCNGWCMTWGVAAQGGTNVCLRNVTAEAIFDSVADHGVTHMGGAPTVLNMIINSPSFLNRPRSGGEKVVVMTGAAPPPPHVLSQMEGLGFKVVHAYGLTETYGPGTYCAWRVEWDPLPADEQAKLKARQGVPHIAMDRVEVMDPATMAIVPSDGRTIGEVMFRGNTVMSGYLKDRRATQQAFEGGWFHTGDLGVRHPDGYIELKDRSKDIIISGGENVSTIEVESVLFGHPGVLEAAVVGRPDHHWGETVCAFVKLKQGWENVGPEEIIKFCRDKLPHYMAPKSVVFGDLPKTSTGKTQKFVLREKAKAMGSITGSKNPSKSKL